MYCNLPSHNSRVRGIICGVGECKATLTLEYRSKCHRLSQSKLNSGVSCDVYARVEFVYDHRELRFRAIPLHLVHLVSTGIASCQGWKTRLSIIRRHENNKEALFDNGNKTQITLTNLLHTFTRSDDYFRKFHKIENDLEISFLEHSQEK